MKKPINNLEYLTKCPLCEKEYGRVGATILAQKRGQITLHLNCSHCQSSSLVFVITNQNGVLSLGMITDITKEEAKKMINSEAISLDEVIDIHEKLKTIDDLDKLI